MRLVNVSTRTYRWRRYDDVFSSGEAVAALSRGAGGAPGLLPDAAAAEVALQAMMDYGFISRVSKKNDELLGLNEAHATVFKVSDHTYYRFKLRELSTWRLRVEVLEVRCSTGDLADSGMVTMKAAGVSHDVAIKQSARRRAGSGAADATPPRPGDDGDDGDGEGRSYAPVSSSGDAFVCGLDEEELELHVACAFARGSRRAACRAASTVRLAVSRGVEKAPPRARPLWVHALRAPVAVPVYATGLTLKAGVFVATSLWRGARGLAAPGDEPREPRDDEPRRQDSKTSKVLSKVTRAVTSLANPQARRRSFQDLYHSAMSPGRGSGDDDDDVPSLPVLAFHDGDAEDDTARAQRRARSGASFLRLDAELPGGSTPSAVAATPPPATRALSSGEVPPSPAEGGPRASFESAPPAEPGSWGRRFLGRSAQAIRKRSMSPHPNRAPEGPVVVEIRLVAFATRRGGARFFAAEGGALDAAKGSDAVRRDEEKRTWRVYARVGEVSGAKCNVPIVIKSQVVLEVGAKISFGASTTTATSLTKGIQSLTRFTRPKVKDYGTDGADFGGERLVVAACVPRAGAQLRVSVYERLKTDLIRTRRLGIATIPLCDVPVYERGAGVDGEARGALSAVDRLMALHSPRHLGFDKVSAMARVWASAAVAAARRRSRHVDAVCDWVDERRRRRRKRSASADSPMGWAAEKLGALRASSPPPELPDGAASPAASDVASAPELDTPTSMHHHGSSLSNVFHRAEPEPRTFQLIAAPRRYEGGRAYRNGSVTLTVWMAPTLLEGPPLLRWLTRHAFTIACYALALLYVVLGCAVVGFPAATAVAAVPLLAYAYVEAPHVVAWVLSYYVNRLAPGLHLRISACRLAVWIDRADKALERRNAVHGAHLANPPEDEAAEGPTTMARTRLAICADVDDFALEHPPGTNYAHSDFLSARSVRVQLSVDHRLLDGAVNALLRRCPIRWSAFPTTHAALRREPDFEPTRAGAVRIDVLRVDTVRCAFDHADGEFNVARFTRELASRKVERQLGAGEALPNALRLTVVNGSRLSSKIVFVVATVRGLRRQTATRAVLNRHAVWNEHFTFPCPDPSSVVHVAVYDAGRGALSSRATLSEQWIVTAKMLVLAPSNVYAVQSTLRHGRGPRDKGGAGNEAYVLEGSMKLRDKAWAPAAPDDDDATLGLRLAYYHDADMPTAEKLAALKPTTALEQLQLNSLETQWKLGHQGNVANMLRDFPLLFDVRDVELTGLNMYVKDLFMGYKGAHERRVVELAGRAKARAPAPRGDDDPADGPPEVSVFRKALAGQKLSASLNETDVRGKHKDTVFVDKVDLRNKLRDPTAPEGVDLFVLAKSFVRSAIAPIFSEADLYANVAHILSGIFSKNLGGTRRDDAVQPDNAGDPGTPDTPPKAPRKRSEDDLPEVVKAIEASKRHAKEPARPLAKRAYAFVDRIHRGSSKYLDEDDNDILVGDATVEGYLVKRVERRIEFLNNTFATKGASKFHLEWCELRGRTLYYTRRDGATGNSLGFTKKLRLGARAYEAKYDRKNMELKLRALSSKRLVPATLGMMSPRSLGEPLPAAESAGGEPRVALVVLAFGRDANRRVVHRAATCDLARKRDGFAVASCAVGAHGDWAQLAVAAADLDAGDGGAVVVTLKGEDGRPVAASEDLHLLPPKRKDALEVRLRPPQDARAVATLGTLTARTECLVAEAPRPAPKRKRSLRAVTKEITLRPAPKAFKGASLDDWWAVLAAGLTDDDSLRARGARSGGWVDLSPVKYGDTLRAGLRVRDTLRNDDGATDDDDDDDDDDTSDDDDDDDVEGRGESWWS